MKKELCKLSGKQGINYYHAEKWSAFSYSSDRKKNETDAKEIANHFNGYFTSVAGRLNRKIAKTKNLYLSYLVPMKEDLFPMPITSDDIEVLMGRIWR